MIGWGVGGGGMVGGWGATYNRASISVNRLMGL